jgi:hypothetical protein
VVRAVGWHACNLSSILDRDGIYTFGCIPPALWAFLGWILCAIQKFLFRFTYFISASWQEIFHFCCASFVQKRFRNQTVTVQITIYLHVPTKYLQFDYQNMSKHFQRLENFFGWRNNIRIRVRVRVKVKCMWQYFIIWFLWISWSSCASKTAVPKILFFSTLQESYTTHKKLKATPLFVVPFQTGLNVFKKKCRMCYELFRHFTHDTTWPNWFYWHRIQVN